MTMLCYSTDMEAKFFLCIFNSLLHIGGAYMSVSVYYTCLLPISVVDSHTNHSVLDIKVNRVKETFRILLLVCVCVCE